MFDTISNEFSGKEFTKEDLMNKFGESIYNSEKEIDENIWTSGKKFSIIQIDEYPELSDKECEMLLEIMDLYGYVSCGCINSEFIQDLKGIVSEGVAWTTNRKNISQWYSSIFPTEEEHNINALKYFEDLKSLRMIFSRPMKIWTKFYTNEDYCNKIMKKDMETYKKYRENEINYFRGLRIKRGKIKPINPWPSLINLKSNEEIINHYDLNTPIST